MLDPDPVTLAAIRALVASYRRTGMGDDQIRRQVLAGLQETLPGGALENLAYESVVAGWQRALDAVFGDKP